MKQKRFVIHCGHFLQGILSCIAQIERFLTFLTFFKYCWEHVWIYILKLFRVFMPLEDDPLLKKRSREDFVQCLRQVRGRIGSIQEEAGEMKFVEMREKEKNVKKTTSWKFSVLCLRLGSWMESFLRPAQEFNDGLDLSGFVEKLKGVLDEVTWQILTHSLCWIAASRAKGRSQSAWRHCSRWGRIWSVWRA